MYSKLESYFLSENIWTLFWMQTMKINSNKVLHQKYMNTNSDKFTRAAFQQNKNRKSGLAGVHVYKIQNHLFTLVSQEPL